MDWLLLPSGPGHRSDLMRNQPGNSELAVETFPPGGGTVADSASGVDARQAAAEAEKKRLKKRGKVRAAWIAFVGRILAHFIGAAATIALGLMFLQQYQATSGDTARRLGPDGAVATVPLVQARVPDAERSLIAVLPFENHSGDAALDHVSDAMTEALTAELSLAEGLGVVSRTSSMSYRGQGKAVPEIARELMVGWLLEGSVVVAGGRARVIVQLIDAATDTHVWVATHDQEFRDVLSLQSELAPRLARDVHAVVTGADLQHPHRGETSGAPYRAP